MLASVGVSALNRLAPDFLRMRYSRKLMTPSSLPRFPHWILHDFLIIFHDLFIVFGGLLEKTHCFVMIFASFLMISYWFLIIFNHFKSISD